MNGWQDQDGAPRHLTIAAELSRVAEARRFIEEVAQAGGLSPARIFELQVAVSEAVANAVEHAQTHVDIDAWLLPDRIVVEVTNEGPFRVGLYKDSPERRRGLGLPLMVSLADDVHVSRKLEGKTRVTLTFLLGAGHADVDSQTKLGVQAWVGEGSAESRDGLQESGMEAKGRPQDGRVLHRPWRGRSFLPQERLLWTLLPIPLLVAAATAVRVLGLGRPRDSILLLTAFNTLFCAAASFIIAYLAARSYRANRSTALLTLGMGSVAFGLTYLLSGPLRDDFNRYITVHNSGLLLAGLLFSLSGFFALRERRAGVVQMGGSRGIVASYLAALIFAVLVTVAAPTGLIPSFHTPLEGFTLLRHLVLGLAVLAFIVAAVSYGLLYRRSRSRFLLWTFSAMAALAVALGILLVNAQGTGTPGVWLSRSGQWLGGLYLLAAVFSIQRAGEARLLPLEQALREAEDRYRNLVDSSPDAVVVHADGKVLFANAAAARLFGVRSPRELMGRSFLDFVHPDHIKEARRRIGHIYAGGVPRPEESRLIRMDGSVVEVELTTTQVRFQGRLAVQTVSRDASGRKRAEELLRQREENFRALADNIPQLAWMADPTGWIFWYNRRWFDYTGTTLEHMRGWGWQKVHHPDHEQRVVESIRRAFESGQPWEDTFPLRSRDGSYRWFLSRALPIRDREGQVVRWFGTHTDITEGLELQRAEQERIRLALATQRMSEILSSSPDYGALEAGLKEMNESLTTEGSAIVMREGERWVIRYASGCAADFRGVAYSDDDAPLVALAARLREPVVVDDVEVDEPSRGGMARAYGMKSAMLIPLIVRGEVAGVLLASHHSEAVAFSAAEVDFARRSGTILSFAVENADMVTSLWLEKRLDEALSDVASLSASELNETVVLRRALTVVVDALPADYGALLQLGSKGWSVQLAAGALELAPSPETVLGAAGVRTQAPLSRRSQAVSTGSLPGWADPAGLPPELAAVLLVPLYAGSRMTGLLEYGFRAQPDRPEILLTFAGRLSSMLSLALQNARLFESQRHIAVTLQETLQDIPQQTGGARFGHLYRSASREASVGGDFYDVFSVKEDRIAVLIGDVSGHGVEAARIATLAKDVIHAFVHQYSRPSVVLRKTNELLLEKKAPGFVTVFLGLIELDTGVLTYSSAGHPAALLRRSGGDVRLLQARSAPLAVFPDRSWPQDHVRLDTADMLFLYTDGVTEARRDGDLYGERRLQDLLSGTPVSVDEVPELVLRDVLSFSGGALHDDVAILALSLVGEAGSKNAPEGEAGR